MTWIQLNLGKDLVGAHVWGDMSSSPVVAFRLTVGDFRESTKSTVFPGYVVPLAQKLQADGTAEIKKM